MQRIGFVVFAGYQVMGFAAASVFEFANLHAAEQLYEVRFLSEAGGSVRTSIGAGIETAAFDDTDFDTLFVGGATEIEPSSPGLLVFLRDAPARYRRVAAPCTGAFVLAEAGLLDGRRATTHWAHARELQARFPKLKVEEDRIFIKDGPIWTSAGMTAGIDLALALVEDDHGQRWRGLLPRSLSSITGAPGDSPSFRRFWNWRPNRTASRPRSPMHDAISIRR